mmetsp:Transcript_11346/g.27730  ORF Transcript_11346/g.27730 Transcript_11346/m.27730 type:complete len:309 (-) Transcript_11346:48-974(-)
MAQVETDEQRREVNEAGGHLVEGVEDERIAEQIHRTAQRADGNRERNGEQFGSVGRDPKVPGEDKVPKVAEIQEEILVLQPPVQYEARRYEREQQGRVDPEHQSVPPPQQKANREAKNRGQQKRDLVLELGVDGLLLLGRQNALQLEIHDLAICDQERQPPRLKPRTTSWCCTSAGGPGSFPEFHGQRTAVLELLAAGVRSHVLRQVVYSCRWWWCWSFLTGIRRLRRLEIRVGTRVNWNSWIVIRRATKQRLGRDRHGHPATLLDGLASVLNELLQLIICSVADPLSRRQTTGQWPTATYYHLANDN